MLLRSMNPIEWEVIFIVLFSFLIYDGSKCHFCVVVQLLIFMLKVYPFTLATVKRTKIAATFRNAYLFLRFWAHWFVPRICAWQMLSVSCFQFYFCISFVALLEMHFIILCNCWVVFEVFIIIIKQIVFFWYDCYRRWQGKETQLRSQVFYSGRHVTVNNTPA